MFCGRVAIFSDSHHRDDLLRNALEFSKSKGVEFLLHAGDMKGLNTLEILHKSGIAYRSVFGNNDYAMFGIDGFEINKEPYYFVLDELRLKMMHLPFYLTPDVDILVYGHTHRQNIEFINKKLFINPGEICGRESGSCQFVILDIAKERFLVECYSFPMDFTTCRCDIFEFERND